MTKVYHEETVPIEFGSAPRVVPKGERLNGQTVTEPTVVVNPAPGDKFTDSLSGPEELRCITNTLSHELEHIRESELTSKATFREQYPTHPEFAGGIINILEDQYIDYIRTRRFPGLKTTEAPHYRRVAMQKQDEGAGGLERRMGIRAGKGFAFVSHTGEVYPSGFLPKSAGSVREESVVDIYRESSLFQQLRDDDALTGKCGACRYRTVCGGSRSRAYATTGDPLCAYQPEGFEGPVPDQHPAD